MFGRRQKTQVIQLLAVSAFVTSVLIYCFLPRHYPRQAAAVVGNLGAAFQLSQFLNPRVNAAFFMVVKESDMTAAKVTIRTIEDRFNSKFNYPYVILSDENLSAKFKLVTESMTKSRISFGKIEKDDWGYPSHVNQSLAMENIEAIEKEAPIFDGTKDNVELRHRQRYLSSRVFHHPLLDKRLEQNTHFKCDIEYDVFQLMKDKGFKFGWMQMQKEELKAAPSFWSAINQFSSDHPEYITQDPEQRMTAWMTDDGGHTFNGCHFLSMFSIISTDFFKSKAYSQFFYYLDTKGGIYYERWSDAMIQSAAVTHMLKQNDIHYFNDIGVVKGKISHCPQESYFHERSCICVPHDSTDVQTTWGCNKRYLQHVPNYPLDQESFRAMVAPHLATKPPMDVQI